MTETKFFYKLTLVMGLCFAAFSCSDEDNLPDRNFPPFVLGDSFNVGTDKDTVVSAPNHLDGQDHRSSEDFSIKKQKYFGYRNAFIRWTLDSAFQNVKFKVKINKAGTDPEIYNGQDITHSTITPIDEDIKNNPTKLYIADPSEVPDGTEKFNVYYEVCIPETRHIYLTCKKKNYSDRSSENIFFQASKYKVICPPDVTFFLRHDKGGQKDEFYIKNKPLANDSIIPAYADAFVCGANKDFILELEPVDDPNYCAWMGRLPDSTHLSQISMPGTHDSATGNNEVSAGLPKCQNFDFPVQMTDGIRYFDIRLNGNLIAHHGGNKTDTSCDMIFDYAKNFLTQYPSETLLFLVTPDNPEKFMEAVDDIEFLYRKNTLPTLGEARGKVVLLRRFKLDADGDRDSTEWGIDVGSQWPSDNAKYFETSAGDKFYIQDRYFKDMVHNTGEKRLHMRMGMQAANSELENLQKAFILQYNSIAGGVRTPWDYAWGDTGVDTAMNVFLDTLLTTYEIEEASKNKRIRTGTIVMDFYNRLGEMYENDEDVADQHHSLVRRIINFNFPDGSKIRDEEEGESSSDSK